MADSELNRQFLGPAARLLIWMEDPTVTDLLINGLNSLYVERLGQLESVDNPFTELSQLSDFIERLLIPLGRRVDAAAPFADGMLADGSRFHIILAPIASEGPCISIRKLRRAGDLLLEAFGSPETLNWMRQQLLAKKNLLIAGGTGAGKTTLLSLLLKEVPPGERIAILEETREIVVAHSHCISLTGRAATPDGKGMVSLRTLLRNALRMRPDRIVVGECRGEEAFDMLQAMSTGHSGSLGTIHANHALDGLRRLETLALLSGTGLTSRGVREWVASAVHGVVYVARQGENRVIREVIEVQGLEGENYRIYPKFQAGTRR